MATITPESVKSAALFDWLESLDVIITSDQLEVLLDWLNSLTPEFLECRERRRHDHRRQDTWTLGPNWWGVKKKCSRCGYSYEEIVHRGKPVERFGFDYPTGYEKPKGAVPGTVARAVFTEIVLATTKTSRKKPPDRMMEIFSLLADDIY